jgi:hypothetical protein
VCLKKRLDELRLGAKDQSSSVIAGSPRNVLRNSLVALKVAAVEHWMD